MVEKVLEGKSLKILVVEDDEGLSHLIRKKLNREGFRTYPAYQGSEAVKTVQLSPPHLIMLDYRLPDMNGHQIVKKLNEMGFSIPFIVMTSNNDGRMAVEMMKLGAMDYLMKEGNYLDLMVEVIHRTITKLESEKLLKQAEYRLKTSEKKYRLLFERDVAGNYHTSSDGLIIDCNAAFARIFGYDHHTELIGKPMTTLYLDSLDQDLFLRDLRQDGVLHGYEMRMRHRNGNPVWVLQGVTLFSSNNGDSDEIQGTLIDITERKKSEEALRNSEELIRGIVTNAPVGISYLDRQGEILYINPMMDEILSMVLPEGFEVKGKRIGDLAPFAEAGVDHIVNRLLAGDIIEGDQVYFKEENWTKKILQFHGAPRRGSGNSIVGAVFMALDVTDFIILEEQFRQSQKMEAIGHLAGGVAHDFNNLLMAISGHTDLALMRMDEEDPHYKAFHEIRKSADRATSVTSRLLAFSRKQMLEPKVININSIILNMTSMLHRIIGEDVELTTMTAPDLGACRVDPGQVEQVILNLAVNARDAMPNGGRLLLETSNAILSDQDLKTNPEGVPGSYIQISVRDTGTGMTEEVISRIFEPFYTTKDLGKGTGLGLATVYGIVKQSGGFISVESELNKGTAFRVYLPMSMDVAERYGEDIELEEIPRGNETVLVVEDEEIVRELASKILEQQGYTVFQTETGPDALMMIQGMDKPADIAVIDVIMPKMSGTELADQLKKQWPKVKILFMSGYTQEIITRNGVLTPGTPYLQKPFQLSVLAVKVREILDQ